MDKTLNINLTELPVTVAEAIEREAIRQKRTRLAQIRLILELEAERIARSEAEREKA